MQTEVVPVETVRPLRHSVLRPGWPHEASLYVNDGDPLAVHAAVRPSDGGAPVAVGSLLPEDPPAWLVNLAGVPQPGTSRGGGRWWRIRGMATVDELRGQGHGRSVLELLLEKAREAGGGAVWCTARLGALSLYRRIGFHEGGDVEELAGIGPHLTMWLALPSPRSV